MSTNFGAKKHTLKATDSKSSYEEGDLIDYDHFVRADDKNHDTERKKEYYYQDYPYIPPTQSDFDRKEVKGTKLFDKTKKIKFQESFTTDDESQRNASILISGFGMRNVDSFQNLIKMSQEERKKWELRKMWRDQNIEASKAKKEEKLEKSEAHTGQTSARTETTEASTTTEIKTKTSTDFLTQTETTAKTTTGDRFDMKHLDYLLGLEEAEIEEEPEPFLDVEIAETEEEYKYSTSKSLREAQRYLRVHRIFECFQFIVAHLLSANPENPIEFILNLLNRSLLYRSGLGEPPLLYERKHINKLFDLMDRLQTGQIDTQQYVTGIKTLGICSFNEEPYLSEEGTVSKETFVEEAYEAELAIFDDLIKRRPEKNKTKLKKSPYTSDAGSVPSLVPPYFIPSDLFKSGRKPDIITPQNGEG